MKRILLIAVTLMCAISPAAHASTRGDLAFSAKQFRAKVVKKHGVRAAGRDIVKFGVIFVTADHRQAVRRPKLPELRRYRDQLQTLATPPRIPRLTRIAVPPAQAPAGTLTPSVKANLPYCTWGPESGGNYKAVGTGIAAGHYGKYQFDQQTWESVGGTGRPDQAPPAEQDERAAMLYAQRGSQPWTNC